MAIRDSILSDISIRDGNQITAIDLDALVRRMLLFDRVVLKSFGLQDVPFLVRSFGRQGLLDLQKAGLLQISCEVIMPIVDLARNGVRELPFGQFSFGMVELAEREKALRRGLIGLQGIAGLKNAERAALEDSILSTMVRPGAGYKEQIQRDIEEDMRRNGPALRAGLQTQLEASLGAAKVPDFKLSVFEIKPRTFRIDTDLKTQLSINDEQLHKLLEPAVRAVANLNQRIADMSAYGSITEFQENEASLLFGKFAGILNPQNPARIEKQFTRVVTLADFPAITPGTRVDVEALLKAKDSAEMREFRAWLTKIENASDEDITKMLANIRNKVGEILSSRGGKVVRFAITTTLGLIPGVNVAAGIGASAVDSFLVDKVFPTSGVCAFLNSTYPSLFKVP